MVSRRSIFIGILSSLSKGAISCSFFYLIHSFTLIQNCLIITQRFFNIFGALYKIASSNTLRRLRNIFHFDLLLYRIYVVTLRQVTEN